jgi:type IV pilus assembly protein PilA
VKNERGFTLIELMIVIAIIAIIAAIAIPNLIEARKGANEASAIGAMRTLASAQALYQSGGKEMGASTSAGKPVYASVMSSLSSKNLVDNVLGGGTKAGYVFTLGTSNTDTWSCTATPSGSTTGTRRFYVDQSGVITFTNDTSNASPNSTSPPLGQ